MNEKKNKWQETWANLARKTNELNGKKANA